MSPSRTTIDAIAAVVMACGCVLMAAPVLHTIAPSPAEPVARPPASRPTPQPAGNHERPPGDAFDDDSSLPAHATPVADYTLVVNVDPTRHQVDGKGTIAFHNRSTRPLGELYFHLYANAFRSSNTRFLSDRRPGGRGTGPVQDYGHVDVVSLSIREHGAEDLWRHAERADAAYPEDATDMRLPLARAVAPGEVVHIDLAWKTKLPSIVERMGYHGSFHMVAQWFPKLARLDPDGTFEHFSFDRMAEFFADFGTYDVTITVPVGFDVGATGPRVSDVVEQDRRTVRHVQSDIHDFAFCAYDDFREHRRTVDGVEVRVLFAPGHDAAAAEQLDTVAFGLRHYGKLYGAYPYPTLTVVNPPPGAEEAGGMEYPTLITTGGRWWRHGNDGSARALTLHELGHQYFYGLVATNERRWPFLDEGLTTFAEVDALDAGWGDKSAAYLGGWSLRSSSALRYVAIDGGHDDVIAKAAGDFASGATYGRLAYARTALVLETLDRVYEGGMRRALGRYARRYRYSHPTPSDLLDSVRETLGNAAEQALHTCLFDRGWIDVAIDDVRCDGAACSVVVTRRGNVVLPVDVDWLHGDGTRTRSSWDASRPQQTLTLETDRDVVGVVLDPEHKLLLDEDLANNAIRRGETPGAWRTRGLLTFAATLLFSAVSP